MSQINAELIKINKWYEEQLAEKEKFISELQNTIAQFVDVRQKYATQQILKVASKVFEAKISPIRALQFQTQKEEMPLFATPNKEEKKIGSFSLPLPPPPPPPQIYSSGRGSRGSKEFRSLPPPPPFLSLPSEFILPPPPPPPIFTLPSPPPFTLMPPGRKSQQK